VPASCLSEQRIAAFVEGRLAGEALATAEEHISSCPDCRALITSMANAIATSPTKESARGGDETPILERNDRVGRYVIQSLLGEGGMGRVYAAHDPALERSVALKLLRPDVAVPDLESRLLREAKAMARITHPHVIAVYDAGRHGDQVYIAMELVSGGTLRAWQTKEPRGWRAIVDVYLRAGEGLAEAHAAGIVHRDFKPDNVLVGDDAKTVRVTDFGLARSAHASARLPIGEASTLPASDPASLDSALTRAGVLVGTPVYMAPEQHAAEGADARSDLYAFCVALYEALYGERPFAATTLARLHAEKIANHVLPAPSKSDVPRRVRRAILAGLRADPAERPESMHALLASLRRASRRSRAPFVVAAAVVVGATAIALGVRARAPATSGAAIASASAIAPAACSNRACAAQHGGEPWVCRASDGACVSVASEDCKAYFEPGDLEADDTVWIGAMFPMTGVLESVGRVHVDAVNLGRREFASATRGLTGPNASLRVRRVAVAVCDDATTEGAERGARHLVDDLGAPAVLGFRSGQEVMDLAGGLLIQRHVVSVATLTMSPLITQIPQPPELPRMVWRTVFSLSDVAVATAGFIERYFEPRRSTSAGPTRVALVRGDAPGPVAFGQSLLNALVFNGKSGIENGDRYQEIAVPQESPPNDPATARSIATRIVAQRADFVVLLTDNRLQVPLVHEIETHWPRSAPRPTYFVAGEAPDASLASIPRAAADANRRAFGVVTLSSTAANAHFVIRFNEAYANKVSRTENSSTSYDAFYLLAYAASAVATSRSNGPDIARAIARLTSGDRAIEVGPTQVYQALKELAAGRAIELEGASGTLRFDAQTGEPAFDYAIVCPRPGDVGSEAVESGLVWRAKRKHVEGKLECP
jgi:ABC-type branched-subunit amino acid transport system substrate-binding protein